MQSVPSSQKTLAPASQSSNVPIARPNLVFVSVAHPDQIKERATNRKIRRHVMKEIGLSRRKKPAKGRTVELDTAVVVHQPNRPIQRTVDPHSQWSPGSGLSRFSYGSSEFPFADSALFTNAISARARRIVTYLHREDSSMCQMLRKLCFTLAMADDSAMYLALADSALYTGYHDQKPPMQENAYALENYNTSLGFLNGRLKHAASAAGNAIIGTVIGLAGYDIRVRNFARWAVHMAGLQRMIESRGGIESITSYHLRMTLIWSDMVGSLLQDLPPRFAVYAGIARPVQANDLSPILSRTIYVLQQRDPVLWDICPVLGTISDLTKQASRKLTSNWYHDTDLTQTFGIAAHELLILPRHQILNDQNNLLFAGLLLRETIRVASLVFLTGAVNHLAGNRDMKTEHGSRLGRLLKFHTLDWSTLPELELWVLVVYALVETTEDKAWAISRISSVMRTNGLSWRGVLGILLEIAWVESVLCDEVDWLKVRIEFGG